MASLLKGEEVCMVTGLPDGHFLRRGLGVRVRERFHVTCLGP